MALGERLSPEKTKIYKKLYLKYFERYKGLVTITEGWLKEDHPDIKITWSWYRNIWVKDDIEFKTEFDTIRGNIIKRVEDTMFEKIFSDRDPGLIKFALERLKPEYMEKKKTEVEVNTPLKINIIKPEDE